MKKCFLFAVILLAAGCFAPDPALQKEWAPADRTYDSLARQLESSPDARNGGELLAKLRTRRDQLPDNPVLGWRTRYWEARALVPQGRWDEALELLRDAERQVDPARYPYDRIRIVGLQSQIRLMRGEYPDSYRGYCETDEYYRRTGDTLRLASTCVNMGVIMQELEDWQRALDYFKAADSLFTLSGTDTYYVKNRLNFANVLYRQGERKRAVGILDTLLRTPECLADTSFRINVLLSYCSYAEGDERGGEAAEAYRLARLSDDRKLIAKSAVALAIERLQRDSAAEALPLLRQALDYVEASDDAEFLLPSLENTAHALYATGQADSAYRTLSRFSAARDSLGADRRLAEVRLMENRAAIEQYETRLTYLHERATWQLRLTLLIVITVVCIAAFICYAFRARRDRERLLNQLHEAENKELNTRLAHEKAAQRTVPPRSGSAQPGAGRPRDGNQQLQPRARRVAAEDRTRTARRAPPGANRHPTATKHTQTPDPSGRGECLFPDPLRGDLPRLSGAAQEGASRSYGARAAFLCLSAHGHGKQNDRPYPFRTARQH